MALTTDTKPVGGFMCSTCGAGLVPDGGDIDWQHTASPTTLAANNRWNWTVKLYPSTTQLSGNVAPSIVYRIAQDTARPTQELQRNGMRIAGGDPGLEVYNLSVADLSGASNLKRSFSIRIDYQVKLGGSNTEATSHGTAKQSWYRSYVTIDANPRVILLNGG